MSSKPCYAHFIFGYRNLQLISSMHLPKVFLLVRWCHAIWLWFSYFLPEENNHVTLLQTFTSLLLPAYLLWTAKCSIFRSIQVFFLSFKISNSAEPTWKTLACLGFHSLLLSFAHLHECSLRKGTQNPNNSFLHHKQQHKEFDFNTWTWFIAS